MIMRVDFESKGFVFWQDKYNRAVRAAIFRDNSMILSAKDMIENSCGKMGRVKCLCG